MAKKDEKEEIKAPKIPDGKDEWKVSLVIVDEEKPPQKYATKGDKTLDEWGIRVKTLNELEKIKEALLS